MKPMRFSLRFGLVILLANFAAGWISSRPALAVEFDIAVIADTNTAIPGGAGNFTNFGGRPSLSGGNVAFRGKGLGSPQGPWGIYTDIGGLSVVADTNTAIPDGSGNFEFFFGRPSLDGGNVAFTGFGDLQAGVYTDIGGLSVVADNGTPSQVVSPGVPPRSQSRRRERCVYGVYGVWQRPRRGHLHRHRGLERCSGHEHADAGCGAGV